MKDAACEPLVQISALNKTYVLNSVRVEALRNIDLKIRTGDFVAIMGRSGSGKSTLLNIMGLLDRPDAGDYQLGSVATQALAADGRAMVRNRMLGFVFQRHELLPRHTALENVSLPLVYAGVPRRERRARAQAALAHVGLADKGGRLPDALSGGEQQRTAIARALVNEPLLILADEPTGALDSRTAQEVLGLFSTLNGMGRTLVVVTHDIEVARYARRVIAMRDGRIAGSFDLPRRVTV